MQNWCLTGCVCDLSQGRGLCPLRAPAAGATGALPLRKCMLQPAARPADPLGGRGAPVALASPRWGGGGGQWPQKCRVPWARGGYGLAPRVKHMLGLLLADLTLHRLGRQLMLLDRLWRLPLLLLLDRLWRLHLLPLLLHCLCRLVLLRLLDLGKLPPWGLFVPLVEGSRHFRRCRLAPPGMMGLLLMKTGPTHVGDTIGAAGSLAARQRPLRAAAGNGCCWLRGGSLLLPLLAADAGRRHLLLRRRRQLSAPCHVQLQPRRSVTLGVRAPLPLTHLEPLLVVHWVVPGEQYAPSIARHTLHVFVVVAHDWHFAEGQWRQLLPLLLVLDRIVELPRQDDTWQVAGSEEATKCRTLSSCTDLVPMLEDWAHQPRCLPHALPAALWPQGKAELEALLDQQIALAEKMQEARREHGRAVRAASARQEHTARAPGQVEDDEGQHLAGLGEVGAQPALTTSTNIIPHRPPTCPPHPGPTP